MAEILSRLSWAAFIAGGVSLALAVILWFHFKIPAVISDLSGRTARRSIAEMRAKNERAGERFFHPGIAADGRGKVTDTIAGIDARKAVNAERRHMATEGPSSPTRSLAQDETAFLGETISLEAPHETAMLSAASDEAPHRGERVTLTIIDEVLLTYTDDQPPSKR